MDNLDGYFNLKEGAKYQVAFWNCHFNIHTTVQPSLCLGELRSTLLVDSWVQGKICEVWKSVSSIICDDGTVQYSVILYTCPYSISVTAILYTEVNISCRVRVHFITPQLQTYVKTEWYMSRTQKIHQQDTYSFNCCVWLRSTTLIVQDCEVLYNIHELFLKHQTFLWLLQSKINNPNKFVLYQNKCSHTH